MKKPLIIYGAGGLGREVLTLLRTLPEWEPIGFIDDKLPSDTYIKGLKVLGDISALNSYKHPLYIVLAMGDSFVKMKVAEQLKNYSVEFPILIHPSVILQDSDTITLGEGSILCAGVVLTTDIMIGTHVLVNLNSTVGHDCRIGDHTSIMCGVNIAGEVHVGQSVLIGSGANILNKVSIGDNSQIGMGSVVLKDVPSSKTVAGVPAKEI
jgi:sugar O-acyltransferase (sialic acid O-acetyltransferase NeuD family)